MLCGETKESCLLAKFRIIYIFWLKMLVTFSGFELVSDSEMYSRDL